MESFRFLPPRFLEIRRIKALRRNAQDGSQKEQFRVADAADLCLDLRNRPSTDIETVQLALAGELLLRQIHLITPFLDFLANDVGGFSFSCHFHKCELDNRGAVGFICYVIIAK